jgi:hypothetical protein
MIGTYLGDRHEAVCYRKLVGLLHPGGLACPHCGSAQVDEGMVEGQVCVPQHCCLRCRRSFNAWTGTLLQGACCPPSELLLELLKALEMVARRDRPRTPYSPAGARSATNPQPFLPKYFHADLPVKPSSPDLP